LKSIILFMLVCCSFITATKAQSLPAHTCGVVYTYDAAGNRTQRAYVCNNSGRTAIAPVAEDTTAAIHLVTQLYPNPTTGRITVSFTQPLNNAVITLLDMTGKVLIQSRKSGNQVVLDLSSYRAGVYILRVMDGKNPSSFTIVKQ
jgi:hypothetical protein